jgi:hypothetical protein
MAGSRPALVLLSNEFRGSISDVKLLEYDANRPSTSIERLSVCGVLLLLPHTSHLRCSIKHNDNFAFLLSAFDLDLSPKKIWKWAIDLICSSICIPNVKIN